MGKSYDADSRCEQDSPIQVRFLHSLGARRKYKEHRAMQKGGHSARDCSLLAFSGLSQM